MIPEMVRGELSALRSDRNAFGLVSGVALVLAVLTMLSASAVFDMFFILAYAVMPIFTTGVAAVLISGDRARGYASVLHTAPITPAAYYAAKLIVAVVWSLLAVVLSLPFVALLGLYVGASFLDILLPWLAVALVMALFAAGLGTMVSVAVGKRGLMASAFAGIGAALGVSLVPIMLTFAGADARRGASPVAHLSPVYTVMQAVSGPAPDLGAWPLQRALLVVLLMASVFGAAGLVMYLRYQNPEGWDTNPRAALPVLAVAALLIVVPVLTVDFGDVENTLGSASSRGSELGLAVYDAGAGQDASDAPQGPSTRFAARTLPLNQQVPMTLGVQVQSSRAGNLTHVALHFRQSYGAARLLVSPSDVDLDDWEAEPCAPSSERPQGIPGCLRYAPRTVLVTVTADRPRALQQVSVALEVRLTSDQGDGWGSLQMSVDAGSGFGWWSPLFVWAAVTLLFSFPQDLRRKTLGRKVALTPVRGPQRPTAPRPR